MRERRYAPLGIVQDVSGIKNVDGATFITNEGTYQDVAGLFISGSEAASTPFWGQAGDNYLTSIELTDSEWDGDLAYLAEIGFYNDDFFQTGSLVIEGPLGIYVTKGTVGASTYEYPILVDTANEITYLSNFKVRIGGDVGWSRPVDVGVLDITATDYVEFEHDGTDFNITGADTTDINISGISGFNVGNYSFDVDQAVGVAQDNHVLTYNNSTGQISLETTASPSQLVDLTITGDFLLTDTVWDDLKFPATAINPPGQASDPGVESTSGLLLFAASGTELIYALAQMPHAWKEGSEISPHVHWQKTTSASGDVAWQIRYKIASIGAVMDASWTNLGTSSTPVAGTPDIDTADYHMITGFNNIDMTGETLSTCILFEVSRLGSDSADTYGADARLLEFDVHYQIDSLGSAEEFSQ